LIAPVPKNETILAPKPKKSKSTVSKKVATEKDQIIEPVPKKGAITKDQVVESKVTQICDCKNKECLLKHAPWCRNGISCRGYNGGCTFRHPKKPESCNCGDEMCLKSHAKWCRYEEIGPCIKKNCTFRHKQPK